MVRAVHAVRRRGRGIVPPQGHSPASGSSSRSEEFARPTATPQVSAGHGPVVWSVVIRVVDRLPEAGSIIGNTSGMRVRREPLASVTPYQRCRQEKLSCGPSCESSGGFIARFELAWVGILALGIGNQVPMENERKWRRIRFAGNLRALIEGTGLNRKEFAERADVPYPWLQRATTSGITRLDSRGREHLDRIARWFGLAQADRLWDRDFTAPPPWNSREARASQIAEDLRRLLIERGEEGEPLKTILRLIDEAKEDVRTVESSRSPADPTQFDARVEKPMRTGGEVESGEASPDPTGVPAVPAPQLQAEGWPLVGRVELERPEATEFREWIQARRKGSARTAVPADHDDVPR